MKRTIIAALTLTALLTLTVVAQKTSTPEAQLGAIIRQAQVEGKYDAAIANYKKFLAENATDKALAAKAQYHLGFAYEKLGNAAARGAYEQVVRDHPNEPVAAEAKKRLESMAGATDQRSLTSRLICADNCNALNSISADGRFGAYFEDDDLAIRDLVAGDVIRPVAASSKGIRNTVGYSRAQVPLVSPDGQQVAYTWVNTIVPGEAAQSQLKVVANKNDERARTIISNDNLEFSKIYPAAWRPDGKAILVTVLKQDVTWQHGWVSLADGTFKVIKSLEWRLQGVWGDRPTLSPDGKYITYAALATNPSKAPQITGNSAAPDPTNEHIYILAADGSTETELVAGANINESPVWMPDGKSILFVSNRTGSFDLWSVSMTDGKWAAPVRVKPDVGRVLSIGVTGSPSYYYRTPLTSVQKFAITALDSGSRPRSSGPEIVGGNPVWSPDGKQIAFTRQMKLDSTVQASGSPDAVLVYFVDTGNERLYKPSAALVPAGRPLWLRDGTALLQVMQDAKGERSLYRIDVKSGEFRQLAPTGISTPPALSRDGKTIYLISKGEGVGPATINRLVAIDLNSGRLKLIANVSGAASSSASTGLSPDGNTFYMQDNQASRCQRIVAVDLTTGAQKEIFCLKNPQALGGFALSPDGQTLAMVIFQGLERQVYRIEVDGTNYRNLGRLSATSSPPIWTRDGTAVIVNGSDSLMRFPANGGNVEVVQPTAWSPIPPDLSPDGSRIAVAVDGNVRPALWALDNVSSFLKTTR